MIFMQAKLHRWAVADLGRRFDDLFNLVCDPATLLAAHSGRNRDQMVPVFTVVRSME
jgi:hypothetical protein